MQPCFDIDECTSDPCVALATCVNLPGTFECPCNSGYEGDGETECTDIDECALDYCDTNAFCSNTIGSVDCFCNAGYAGNGTYCENVNECEQESACQEFATCFDNIGSFYCTCDAGYRLHAAQVGPADEDVIDLCVEIVDCEDGYRGGCSHSCSAGECICPACWELGLNGKDCSPSPQETEVVCAADGIQIKMSDCVIGDNQVQLTDGNCQPTLNANGTQAILSTQLNECGTTAFHKGDCIMFSNQVIFTPPPVGFLRISAPIAAQVDCFFNATAQASNYFTAVNGSTPQNIQLKSVFSLGQEQISPNEFLTEVRIFEDDRYEKETEFSVLNANQQNSMIMGEMIYASVSALHPIDGIYFTIESCAVVEGESGEEYFIIEDQCPNREVEAHLAIPDEEEIRFAFKAFSFTKSNGKNLSISCQIKECSVEDPSNPCEVSPQC